MNPHPIIRRIGPIVAAGLAFVLVVLGLGEVGLRLAALFAHDRVTGWRPQAQHRILCVGDSHTFGFMVPPDETYPAHLGKFLDEQAPGSYSVINLGIPGMNTTQVRNRLDAHIARYQPDTVVVWCGANNTWNHAEVSGDARSWSMWIDGIVNRSRVYRFVRVWIHNVRVESESRSATARMSQRPDFSVDRPWSLSSTFTLRHWDGSKEHITNEEGEQIPESAAERQALRDFGAMAQSARAAGIKLLFVLYPTDLPAFAFANRAMRRAAAQDGLRVVESAVSVQRVPLEERKWLAALHPSGPIYREIARDVAGAILEQDRTGANRIP